jgi:hypothetical protein
VEGMAGTRELKLLVITLELNSSALLVEEAVKEYHHAKNYQAVKVTKKKIQAVKVAKVQQ